MKIEKVQDLKNYFHLRFAITLPPEIMLSYSEGHGIRAHNPAIHSLNAWGIDGIMAYSNKTGLGTHFIQLVGHLAKRNVIALNEKEAKEFAAGRSVRKKLSTTQGECVVSYKGHVLGIGSFNAGVLSPNLREKTARETNNSLRPYPGRNL